MSRFSLFWVLTGQIAMSSIADSAVDSNPFDLSFSLDTLDELDPSLSDGFKCIYEKEVPIEIRTVIGPSREALSEDISTPLQETIKLKILTKGGELNHSNEIAGCTNVRMEFSSESDLFFHYYSSFASDTFDAYKEQQRLMIDFLELPHILVKMMNACIREPQSYLAILALYPDGSGKLEMIQNMEYKHVELLSLSCRQSEDEIVQRQITFRYNSLKQRMLSLQSKLQDINSMVKTKNPSLLLQMQSSARGRSGSSIATLPGSASSQRYENITSRKSIFP